MLTVLMGTAREKNRYLEELRSPVPPAEIYAEAIDHGKQYEPIARAQYELRFDVTVIEAGFIKHPRHDRIGGSPDGLILPDGGLEIKCPLTVASHAKQMKYVPLPHFAQCQAYMWITESAWWDYVSFCPHYPNQKERFFCARVFRQESFIEKLERSAGEFLSVLDSGESFEESEKAINFAEIPKLF